MKAVADRSVCVGAGQCVHAAPDYFDQDEAESLVEVLQADVQTADLAAVREAEFMCPSRAISVVD